MPQAQRDLMDSFGKRNETGVVTTHLPLGAPRRQDAEAFIRRRFAERYGARIGSFAPNLVIFEERGKIIAASGWRAAGHEKLFLERYLEQSIEDTLTARLMSSDSSAPLSRERIVEVGHLASGKSGGSLFVILNLARHLDRMGFEWVVFTATQELIGIFSRLGLPLLAIASANPECLGDDSAEWGSYYDTRPIVVAGRIRLGIQRQGERA